MILQPEEVRTDELTCQVCVVGSGAAGVTLAKELSRRGLSIVLVTGGAAEETPANRDLHRGTITPANSHEPLEENRCRALGGGTRLWGGRLVPYDPIDFERREFVPLSGWPITYEEVARYYPAAAALCEVTSDTFYVRTSAEKDLPVTLGDNTIETNLCERWSMPTDFGVRYREELVVRENVRVLLDYHAVELRLSDDHRWIAGVEVRSRSGRPTRVTADTVILATGGIENARLLLASSKQRPEGVANQQDMVGRCYMSHLAGNYGSLRLNTRRSPFYDMHRDDHGMFNRRRFRLTDDAQRRLQVMNIIAFPFRPMPDDPRHGDAVLSALYLREVLRRHPVVLPPTAGRVFKHLKNLAFTNPAAYLCIYRQLKLRNAEPRFPFFLPYKPSSRDVLFFQVEHAPNLESRLLLSDDRDEFGMPRIRPQVRFIDLDLETVRVFYRQLDQSLRASGAGSVDYRSDELEQCMQNATTNFNSVAHHLGTTRMTDDPKLGVVDKNCRAHTVDNLYLMGGSVFTTSGHANPTMNILALTLRLIDHLEQKFQAEGVNITAASQPKLHSAEPASPGVPVSF